MGRRADFSEDTKVKCFLWSDRHCCLCGKPCGTDIEVAHVDSKGGNDLDNAIPLCYECHSAIGKYNKEHPRGNKYRPKELKTRRDQIYEKYTRHLVPPIHFEITQRIGNDPHNKRSLPIVGFNVTHYGDSLPVRFTVVIRAFLGNKELGLVINIEKPYYSGGIMWNINPRHIFFGNFSVPKECVDSTEDLKLEAKVTIIDKYDRLHELLPVCYTYMRDKNDWFMEPTSFSELKRFIRCVQEGISDREFFEALNIALVVGGSITIPHIRRAVDILDQCRKEQAKNQSIKI